MLHRIGDSGRSALRPSGGGPAFRPGAWVAGRGNAAGL